MGGVVWVSVQVVNVLRVTAFGTKRNLDLEVGNTRILGLSLDN